MIYIPTSVTSDDIRANVYGDEIYKLTDQLTEYIDKILT